MYTCFVIRCYSCLDRISSSVGGRFLERDGVGLWVSRRYRFILRVLFLRYFCGVFGECEMGIRSAGIKVVEGGVVYAIFSD